MTVPVDPKGEGRYQVARRNAEALMTARKTARNFDAIGWNRGSGQPKSSLDGARESVIPEGAYPNRDDSEKDKERKTREIYEKYGARPAERLSGETY